MAAVRVFLPERGAVWYGYEGLAVTESSASKASGIGYTPYRDPLPELPTVYDKKGKPIRPKGVPPGYVPPGSNFPPIPKGTQFVNGPKGPTLLAKSTSIAKVCSIHSFKPFTHFIFFFSRPAICKTASPMVSGLGTPLLSAKCWRRRPLTMGRLSLQLPRFSQRSTWNSRSMFKLRPGFALQIEYLYPPFMSMFFASSYFLIAPFVSIRHVTPNIESSPVLFMISILIMIFESACILAL